MRLDVAYRLSSYLTLAAASLCLAVAVLPFLPESVVVLVGLLVVGLGGAILLRGRWAMMGSVKLLLAAAAGGGAAFYLLHTAGLESLRSSAELPPHVGLGVVGALAAWLILLRQAADFWKLQGFGLLAVALSCALADDPLIGLFVPAYLACATWSLALYYLHQRSLTTSPTPIPWRWLGFKEVGRWALFAGLGSLLLLLLTPDPPSFGNAWRSGLSGALDLNRTGTVVLDGSPAVLVSVIDGQRRPKLDLDPQQYWRGAALFLYQNGHWTGYNPAASPAPPHAHAALPFLGARQLDFTFDLWMKPPCLSVLADPVTVPESGASPVVSLVEGGRQLHWSPWPDGAWVPEGPPFPGECLYRQVTLPARRQGLSHPVNPHPGYLHSLRESPSLSGIQAETESILLRLRAERRLAAEDLRAALDGSLLPENHERVARALAEHLSASGEYVYSLTLTRSDRNLDPTEDFLCNLRSGHCERYASALTLMLRSQGIPARVVVGFCGAESLGDGAYLVRNSFAHAWVEALVSRPRPDEGTDLYWLRLDPTPPQHGAGVASDGRLSGWLRSSRERRQAWWKQMTGDLASGTKASYKERLRKRLEGKDLSKDRIGLSSWLWPIGLLLALLSVWLIRRYLKRKVAAPEGESVPGEDFYARLLAILARYCRLSRRPAQTPREFSATAASALQRLPATVALAAIPMRAVALFYRLRFGRHALSDAERRGIDSEVDQLEAALVPKVEKQTPAG